MLVLQDVRAGYGPIEVLKGISLEVREKEIVTMIGANGAGKTTTLLAVSGINRIRSGAIRLDGEALTGLKAHEIVARGLSHVPEGRKIFPRLSVLENLEMGAYTRSDRAGIASDLDRAFALFPILKDRRGQAGGTLSGGEQQMLAIARALMSRPRLLMMDEPSLGLAPMIVLRIFEVIRELNREGVTVLLVEQNARAALKLAHRGYVLETGSITATAEASALLADPRIQEAYLGE